MNKNATNSVKLKELMDEKEETEALLMEKWTDGSIWKIWQRKFSSSNVNTVQVMLMAYSELIKKFDKVRNYMRDFYAYGFHTRNDFDKKKRQKL